jgi:hypothetical protein
MLKGAVMQKVAEKRFQRELGQCSGTQPDPLVVCIGGTHGNEPAGGAGVGDCPAKVT